MDVVARLLQPASVAIVGASSDPQKLTGRPMAYLQRHGFAGKIYPVNPRLPAIGEVACHADVASLPEAPDVGLVLLGADRVTEAVRQLAARGCGTAIVLASGFGESGPEGRDRQEALRQAAGGMRLLGPNTIGLVNLTDGIMLSASGALELQELPAGRVAVVSQSGGILGSLLSRGVARGIGFSKLIATGNEADLEVADFVEHLLADPATGVIALYLESLRNPARFRAAAERAARLGKPIVAFKVGRSESGARSAVSHTGALAGADRVYDALFRQTGVIRAATFADLLDLPMALSTGRRLAGRRIAIVTSTGGAATLIADAAGVAGFDIAAPDETTAAALRRFDIRDAVLDRNPIDVTLAGLRPDLMTGIIDTVLASPTYDGLAVIVGSSGIGQPELVATPVAAALAKTTKPILAYVSPEAPAILAGLNRRGVPAFAAPEGCAAALAALLAGPVAAADDAAAQPVPQVDLPSAGPLNEAESKQLFASFGIPGVREIVAGTPDAAAVAARQIDGRVVVKILSRHILHKSEVGGVAVGIEPAAVAEQCRRMQGSVARTGGRQIEGFLVQELVAGATELILGFHRDPQLGPVVLLGLGGVATELYQDTALRLPPVGSAAARDMIATLKAAPLLTGFRGRPAGDLDAVVAAIMAFSQMVLALGDRLAEAEINPLFVLPQGQGVKAGDAVVVLR